MDLIEQLESSAREVESFPRPAYFQHLLALPGVMRGAAAELARLRADNENLRSVMIAAAEEISEHWAAHCDSDGYGPANLMHRLEAGIPSEYGYKAGDFARLRAEVEAAKMDAARLRAARAIVDEQAEEEGLWFIPDSVVEAFFQQELRRLHAAIEGDAALTNRKD